MSKYLKHKLMSKLKEAHSHLDFDCKEIRDSAVKEGYSSLKNQIKNVDVPLTKNEVVVPDHEPRYVGSELAEVAVDVYKSNIKKDDGDGEDTLPKRRTARTQYGVEPYITPARRHEMVAIARSLAGMRNGGNAGAPAPSPGPNGGNTGLPESNYHALTSSMTLEEYEAYINESWDIDTDEKQEEEVVQELLVETTDAVSELEDQLLQLEDHSWQSIDKVMRAIAKEHSITPKQLHKDFKSNHDGMIPDEWVKTQIEEEVCGVFPLSEALLTKQGMVYEVSMIWKGETHRLKFFWPELAYPSKSRMAEAASRWLPGARLLAYYPSEETNENFMVVVPPLTENYEVVREDEWVQLSEDDLQTLDRIEDEEGEILGSPELLQEGIYEVWVKDYDTGEPTPILFGEKRGLWDNIHAKRKRGESPAKKGDKDYPKTLNVEDKNPCWKGYKRKPGTKKFADGSCVKESDMKGMSQKSGDKRSTESGAGMTAKGVAKYNARTGGDLKTAVTTPPSKLKAGSKAAGRRKSFCARSRSWDGERGKAARRRWNC